MKIFKREPQAFASTLLPLVILSLGLGLSVAVAWRLHNEISAVATADFERGADRISSEIARRFRQPVYGLNGAKGVYVASKDVTRAEFRAYVASRDMAAEFPGVRGLGFIQLVKRQDLATFEVAERADGAPQFRVHQLNNNLSDEFAVVKFIEPAARNPGAAGLDINSEAHRSEAAQRAIDSGEATLSAAISLVQSSQTTPGMLIFVPVYANGQSPSNPTDRRTHLRGLVYAPIVIRELLENLTDVQTGRFDFELFDSPQGTPTAALVYDADIHMASQPPSETGMKERKFQLTRQVALLGRDMQLRVSSTPAFEASVPSMSPWLVLAGGVLASILLSLVIWQQASGRRRAETLARQMTSDLDRLALVARKTSNAVIISDASGRITWVNEGFERLSGYTSAEVVGEATGHWLHFEDSDPGVIQGIGHSLAQGEPFDGEVMNRSKDGRLYWLKLEIQPLRARTGTLTGFVAIESDITDQKRVECELRALEAEMRRNNDLLNSVMENLPCGLSVFDGNLHLVASNRELRDMLALPEALFSHPPTRFEDIISYNAARGEYGAENLEATVQGIIERASSPTPHRFERLRPDGTTLEVRGGPLPGGGFVSTYTNISDRKKAEDDVKRSDRLLRNAMNAMDEAFVLYDPDDCLVFCNEKYRSIYPEVAELLIPGAKFENIIRTAAERGAYSAALGRVEEWVAERMVAHRTGNVAIEQQLEVGRILRVIDQKMPDGHIVGFRFDITELVHSREAALQASITKSQFLANMSHELRTPMNAILGMLALMGNTGLSPRQSDYTSKTEIAARLLMKLLNEILDFSKIEAGKMTLEIQPFRMDKLLRELSVILTANVGSKNVEMLFDIDPELPRNLVGDAMRLQQVLTNLCSNAIKFTSNGEVVLSVAVMQLNDAQVTLNISVRDTGIGIAPENQTRIFSGFTQAEASTTRRFGGSGLGVAISQRFVNLMGGELKLESALDHGSRFFFDITLPLAQNVEPEPSENALHLSAPPVTWRALVVDDNPTAQAVLARMGQALGWKVDVASSGEQALELLTNQPLNGPDYQAIFVDWQMPGMDGWQTCQRIRELHLAGLGPVVVMVTAHGREMLAQRSQADQSMLDGFLVKPVTASMLFDSVINARSSQNMPHPSSVSMLPRGQRLANLRLLLVEDNLVNQQVAFELLENEGADIRIANDGQEAIDILSAAPYGFDVVLMDLQMPVMDGFDATRHIRQVLGLLEIPIVAMTADAMTSDREACLAVGMNDHVGKPFDLTQLVRLLRKCCGLPEISRHPAPVMSLSLPSKVSDAAHLACVDIESALNRMGGKTEVYQQMLLTFVNDLADIPAQLGDSLAQGETLSACRLLHSLKGLAATLGATQLSAAAADGEVALKRGGHALSTEGEWVTRHLGNAIAVALPALNALRLALQDMAPQAPPPQEPMELKLDSDGLVVALQSISRQLQDSDMAATDAMVVLRRRFGPALGDQLQTMDMAVSALDFERALALCRALLKKHMQ